MKTSDALFNTMAKSGRRLETGDVVRFDTVCNGMKIECREGRLWITQTDLKADIVLGTGEILNLGALA